MKQTPLLKGAIFIIGLIGILTNNPVKCLKEHNSKLDQEKDSYKDDETGLNRIAYIPLWVNKDPYRPFIIPNYRYDGEDISEITATNRILYKQMRDTINLDENQGVKRRCFGKFIKVPSGDGKRPKFVFDPHRRAATPNEGTRRCFGEFIRKPGKNGEPPVFVFHPYSQLGQINYEHSLLSSYIRELKRKREKNPVFIYHNGGGNNDYSYNSNKGKHLLNSDGNEYNYEDELNRFAYVPPWIRDQDKQPKISNVNGMTLKSDRKKKLFELMFEVLSKFSEANRELLEIVGPTNGVVETIISNLENCVYTNYEQLLQFLVV